MQSLLMDLTLMVVLPVAITAISTTFAVLTPILVKKFIDKLGISNEQEKKALEEKWVASLHAAGANGLKIAMVALGKYMPVEIDGRVKPELLSVAIDYVKAKNPETVAKLGVSDKDIADVILSKVPDLVATLRTK